MEDRTISVLVPAYNEEDVIGLFHERLSSVLNSMNLVYEIVYVNDGSTDNTIVLLEEIASQNNSISIIDLSRNFGKEIAMTAGLDVCVGDAVVIIDADLQDPPELIPKLYDLWVKKQVDVVYAKRTKRQGESVTKKLTALLFYKLIKKVSGIRIPENTGDFRIISRRVVKVLRELKEKRRFMKGLFSWVGFSQVEYLYERDPRALGETKWNYWKLWNFAIEGITSFTIAPLKVATYMGVFIAFISFCYGIYIIFDTLIYGNAVPGYPSLMTVMLFLGGIQLTALGILGEYIGRIFMETKDRPLYLVQQYIKSDLKKRDDEEV